MAPDEDLKAEIERLKARVRELEARLRHLDARTRHQRAELRAERAELAGIRTELVKAGASMADIKQRSATQRRKPPECTNGDCPRTRRRRRKLVA